VDAYVHVHDAGFYGAPRGGGISQSTLFQLEAVAAGIAAVVLIIGWPVPLGRRADWLGAFIVAASAVGAVLLYRYVDVETIGPPTCTNRPGRCRASRCPPYAEGGAAVLSALGSTHGRKRIAPASQD